MPRDTKVKLRDLPGYDYVKEPLWFTERERDHILYLYMTDQRTLDYIALFIFWYQLLVFLHGENEMHDFGDLRSSITYWDVWRLIVKSRPKSQESQRKGFDVEYDSFSLKVDSLIRQNNHKVVLDYIDECSSQAKDSGQRDSYRTLINKFIKLTRERLVRSSSIKTLHEAIYPKDSPQPPDEHQTVNGIIEFWYYKGDEREIIIRRSWKTDSRPQHASHLTSRPSASNERHSLPPHASAPYAPSTPEYPYSFSRPVPSHNSFTIDPKALSSDYQSTPRSTQPIQPNYAQPTQGYGQPIPGYAPNSSHYLNSSNITGNPIGYPDPQPPGAFDSYENPARGSRQPSSSAAPSSGAAHKDEPKKRSRGSSGRPSSSAARPLGRPRKSDKEKSPPRSHRLGSPKRGRKRHPS
ncbi:MAG: hypothetical protein Q9202_005411 [Teloschistes flavicans]